MISAATRLSAHPNTTVEGCCEAASRARSSMLWLGCSGLPATNRSLPSLSAFHAVTGVVFGMVHIMPDPHMMIPPNELIDWYERSRRELPWRETGVTPWQILV